MNYNNSGVNYPNLFSNSYKYKNPSKSSVYNYSSKPYEPTPANINTSDWGMGIDTNALQSSGNLVPTIGSGGATDQNIADYTFGLTNNLYNALIPYYTGLMDPTGMPLPELPAYENAPSNTAPTYTSLMDTINQLFPNLDITQSTYAQNASPFQSVGSLTDISNEIAPQLDSYTNDLLTTLNRYKEDQTKDIENTMLARGMLGSGAEIDSRQKLAERMGETFGTQLSGEKRRLVEALQNLRAGENQARTQFGESAAGRQQNANQTLMSLLTGLGQTETTGRQNYANQSAAYNQNEFNRRNAYNAQQANLPSQQWGIKMGQISDSQNLLNSLLTGGQASTSQVASILNSIEQNRIAQQSVNNQTSTIQNQEDAQSNALLASLLGAGGNILGNLWGGGSSNTSTDSWF